MHTKFPKGFAFLLIVQTLFLAVYTLLAIRAEGFGFLQIAADNIAALNWSGQFALDFSCYLLLSGLWLMWRGQFKASSIGLGLVAMVAGILFFAPYLLYLLYQAQGNWKVVLLGENQ